MDYVQHLLWSSGELGRCVCRRGWIRPEAWALAPAETPAAQVLTEQTSRLKWSDNANQWLDAWVMAQGEASQHFCLVVHDPLAPPIDEDHDIFNGPGRWDVRGEESYLVLPKEELAPGAVQAATKLMLGAEYIFFVIEDKWPFGGERSLESLAYGVRHVIVPIAEGESYGIVSGA